MEYNAESRLKMINEYLEKSRRCCFFPKKYGYDLSKIKRVIKLYKMHGEAPFGDKQASRIYSREEKPNAINSFLVNKIS